MKIINKLYELANEVGSLSESGVLKYDKLYEILNEAIDYCDESGITYEGDDEKTLEASESDYAYE